VGYKETLPGDCVTDKNLFFTVNHSCDEVILDHAADTDFFQSEAMLTALRGALQTTRLRGAVGGPHLDVKRVGAFMTLGDSILVHPAASANLLSGARLRDDGHLIAYHHGPDNFTVEASDGSVELVFQRRRQPNGAMGGHYAWLSGESTAAAVFHRYQMSTIEIITLTPSRSLKK